MGGLACSLALAKKGFTNIHVFETASNLGFVGAGIQLAPNMARILDRLGCWKDIVKEAVDLRETSIVGTLLSNPSATHAHEKQRDRRMPNSDMSI